MRKTYLLIVAALLIPTLPILAQQAGETSEKSWKIAGENTFLINQSSFSNWAAGGVNAFSANLLFNYDLNYKKDKWSWDNKAVAAYGLSKQRSIGWRKNDDRLILNTLLGYQAAEKWLYTLYGNFNTQFADGFQYDKDNNAKLISRAFAPAYLSFGPGIAYKESDNLRFNLSPAAVRLIVVRDRALAPSFGLDPGSRLRTEFGASLDAYYKANLMENVSIENSLKLYSNYLEDPQNVDLDYTLNLFMKVNQYISINGGLQLLYDDNTLIPREKDGVIIAGSDRPALQVRQVFGAGITYKF